MGKDNRIDCLWAREFTLPWLPVGEKSSIFSFYENIGGLLGKTGNRGQVFLVNNTNFIYSRSVV